MRAAVRRRRRGRWRCESRSDEELHGRQRGVAVEQVDALERHAQRAVRHGRGGGSAGADVELHLVALRLGVVERRAQHEALRRGVDWSRPSASAAGAGSGSAAAAR